MSFKLLRRFVAFVGTIALVAAIAPVSTAQAGNSQGLHAQRAKAAYNALQTYFYDDASKFYLEEYPKPANGNPWSYVWPFSQAQIATQDVAGIPGNGHRYADDVEDRFDALEDYWNAGTTPPGYDSYLRPPLGQGGDKFYDDNEWIGLSFLQEHYTSRHGDKVAVNRAKQIFDLVVHGWDTDPSHPCPGGVYWTQAPWSQDRNTVSNGPGAELGLHLYLLTKKKYYLDWSIKMYEWTRGCMLAPNKLYWDHIDLAGNVQKTQWSYNQGVMIGAGALLYRATGNRKYLAQAEETAKAALAFYAEDERYFTQPARFHAIFFSNLLQLSSIRSNSSYRKAMEWYANESYKRFRDPATGLYRFEGDGPVTLLEQSGMIRIEAMLAWSKSDYRKLT